MMDLTDKANDRVREAQAIITLLFQNFDHLEEYCDRGGRGLCADMRRAAALASSSLEAGLDAIDRIEFELRQHRPAEGDEARARGDG